MGISNLWKRGINQDGFMGVVDNTWLIFMRIELILFIVLVIIAIISILFAKKQVDTVTESFKRKNGLR